jgi:hypothetical protein
VPIGMNPLPPAGCPNTRTSPALLPTASTASPLSPAPIFVSTTVPRPLTVVDVQSPLGVRSSTCSVPAAAPASAVPTQPERVTCAVCGEADAVPGRGIGPVQPAPRAGAGAANIASATSVVAMTPPMKHAASSYEHDGSRVNPRAAFPCETGAVHPARLPAPLQLVEVVEFAHERILAGRTSGACLAPGYGAFLDGHEALLATGGQRGLVDLDLRAVCRVVSHR